MSDLILPSSKREFRGAHTRRLTNQNIPNATNTLLLPTFSEIDTDGIYGGTSGFTVPAGVIRINFKTQVVYDNNGTGIRKTIVGKNGTFLGYGECHVYNPQALENTFTYVETGARIVTAGDYFEVICYQTSGAALNLQSAYHCWAEMEILEFG